MPLPAWMHSQLAARGIDLSTPKPDTSDEPTGLTRCTCGGEGCDACDNTGVTYP